MSHFAEDVQNFWWLAERGPCSRLRPNECLFAILDSPLRESPEMRTSSGFTPPAYGSFSQSRRLPTPLTTERHAPRLCRLSQSSLRIRPARTSVYLSVWSVT
jgi:hypothetical protein